MASVVEIPIFPLSDVVLLPGLRTPLHIFEPRYRRMMEAVLAGDRRIGMVAVLPEEIDSMHGNPMTFSIGCAGDVEDCERLQDGRYNIVLHGTQRFRIRAERPATATRLFRIAEVELLEEIDDPEDAAELERLGARLASLLGELSVLTGRIGDAPTTDRFRRGTQTPNPFGNIENAVLIDSIANAFRFSTVEKQALLEEAGRCARLERLCGLLHFALAEHHAARVPDSRSPNQFSVVNEKRRYS